MAGRSRPRRGDDTDRVYSAVLEAIIDQRLPPGSRLAETELAELFGLSRRKVEKAITRLVAEDLATVERNRGAFVAQPGPEEARQLFALRRVIEREVASLIAAGHDAGAIDRLRAILGEEREARDGAQPRRAVRHSGDFHVVLAECCGNDEIAKLMRRLVARTSLVVQLYRNEEALAGWHAEHGRLVELLAAGDAAGAAELMDAHLRGIENALRLEGTPARGLERVLFGI